MPTVVQKHNFQPSQRSSERSVNHISVLEYTWSINNTRHAFLSYQSRKEIFRASPSNGPCQEKNFLRACTKCADSHYPACLVRAFALHWNILQYPMILFADNEGPDQTARMRRLIWAFAVLICPKTRFAWRGPHMLLINFETHFFFKLLISRMCSPLNLVFTLYHSLG